MTSTLSHPRQFIPAASRIRAGIRLGLVLVAMGNALAGRTPFTPERDSTVIATLRPSALTASERQYRTARAALTSDPTNLTLALDVARQALRRARAESDPHYLGHASLALAPWWNAAVPPVELLVMRATVRQSRHEFAEALADLNAAVARDPRHAAAWLTKVTLHTVLGDVPAARASAVRLLTLADPLTIAAAIAPVAALEGQPLPAIRQLEAALQRAPALGPDATPEQRDTVVWAGTVLAELLARAGRTDEAEAWFRRSLAQAPADPYLLGAFADFLLDQRRPAEVLPLLRDFERMDALLLRLAEAQRAVSPGSETAAVTQLRARFEAARARGDRLHLREEARFHLRLLGDFATARRLAEENWSIQKEPADARLLEETEPENRP
jgi:tetratricopeptide (TPR) repeat protein